MRRGRPKRIVELTEEQREELGRWTRRATTAQALALRARVILACAEGGDDVEVAARLGVDRNTVGKWRRRFVSKGTMDFSTNHAPARRVRFPTPMSNASSCGRSRRSRETQLTGARARWLQRSA